MIQELALMSVSQKSYKIQMVLFQVTAWTTNKFHALPTKYNFSLGLRKTSPDDPTSCTLGKAIKK